MGRAETIYKSRKHSMQGDALPAWVHKPRPVLPCSTPFYLEKNRAGTRSIMLPEVILHTATGLDGRITNFPAGPGLCYTLAIQWNSDTTLCSSETILAVRPGDRVVRARYMIKMMTEPEGRVTRPETTRRGQSRVYGMRSFPAR
jgi:hypothetical protein